MVTEYYPKGDLGKDLEQRYKSNNPYSENELIEHIQHLLAGFAKLQKNNISHRDIKPENIFISNDNKLKIGDLGSSQS